MQIIAIISQKGGVGKSTVSINLAVEFTRQGKKTGIIDLDPQGSATNWGRRRKAPMPVVVSAHSSQLEYEINQARDAGIEVLILDTAPHADGVAFDAAEAADLVVIPALPNIFDIEAGIRTIKLIQNTRTPHFAVLNDVPAVGPEADEAAAAFRDSYKIAVCPVRMVHRIAYARSVITGHGVSEYVMPGRLVAADPKAKREVEQLHTYVCEHLNTLQPDLIQTPTDEAHHVQAQ